MSFMKYVYRKVVIYVLINFQKSYSFSLYMYFFTMSEGPESPLVVLGVPWPPVDSAWTLILRGRYIMIHYVIRVLPFFFNFFFNLL